MHDTCSPLFHTIFKETIDSFLNVQNYLDVIMSRKKKSNTCKSYQNDGQDYHDTDDVLPDTNAVSVSMIVITSIGVKSKF